MSKTTIHSPDAPAAVGPYSQAVRHGDLVFLSGQIPLDPETEILLFSICVRDRLHLSTVLRRLKRNINVLRVNLVR